MIRSLLPFLAVLPLLAQAPNTLTPAEKAAGWKLLFDGQSYRGWNDPGKRNPPGDSWAIEDGAIRSRPNPKIREDLMTVEKFTDFELTFQWRISPGANSGVKYAIQDTIFLDKGKENKSLKFEEQVAEELRTRRSDRKNLVGQGEEYVVGFEYQVIDDSKHADAQRGPKYQAGALYSLIGATAKAAKPAGEWNEGRIVKKGAHVEHWLNGRKVMDGSLDDPAIRAGAESRWKPVPRIIDQIVNRPAKAAPVGLQNHNDEAWFRNIKVRPL